MMYRTPPSGLGRRVAPLAAAALLAVGTGCRLLTETDDDRRCRRLNAFPVDTAQMRVGQSREFHAMGFEPAGPGSCVGAVRGGFTYSTDAPAIASVGTTSGGVTALGVGTARLRAQRHVDGAEYHGQLELRVSP